MNIKGIIEKLTRGRGDFAEGSADELEVDAAAIIRQARRLRFRVRPGAIAALAGAYLGARPGTGLTFAELRAYEPGDDVRRLDWNATARQGRPYVRRCVEERALTVWLAVDVSASMRFGGEGETKADRAAQAAALLAAAAIQNGDRVGLLLVTDHIETELLPAGGARHLARIVRSLVAASTSSKRTSLGAVATRLGRTRRGALILLISDFLSHEPVGRWRGIARRNDLIALRIVDPREEAPPRSGLVDIADLESGRKRTIDLASRSIHARYIKIAKRRSDLFLDWCADAGATPVRIDTTVDPLLPLLRCFQGREAAPFHRPKKR